MKEQSTKLVDDSAGIIRDDIRSILANQEALTSPEAIGSPIGVADDTAEKQSGTRRRNVTKRKLGLGGIGIPRVSSGRLLQGVEFRPAGEDRAVVAVAGSVSAAAETQQRGGGAWTDEEGIPSKRTFARPFFGVSDRALKAVDTNLQGPGANRLLIALQFVELAPFTIEIN